MKEFFAALKDNLSNVFSLVGIALTVYFAVFYVPNYVEELEIEKIEATHEALVESIQELVYNNHKIDPDDIATLIKGKELAGQIDYPFTSKELLIQVQDRFLENRFIPLDQRKSLIDEIDQIRSQLPKGAAATPLDKEDSLYIAALSWLSIALGLVSAGLGLMSIWSKNRKLEELRVEETIEDRQESIGRKVHTSMVMERNIYETLKSALGPNHVEYCPPSTPVDFIIRLDGKDTAVEVKYTETEIIPIRIINQLISAALELDMPVVLICNASLTANARKRISDFNSQHRKISIKYLNIDESKDIESDIRSIFGSLS